MPKRTDIHSIAIIGAGPIRIGQACEFDYAGTQACKSLKEEGYRVILVNSNPATIMTDPELADATYLEPITHDIVEQILEYERPDAILPTMGGQTALNLACSLAESRVLERLGIEMIGADQTVIAKAEDRQQFRAAMERIGLAVPCGEVAANLDQALSILGRIGLPAVVRPSYTLGGSGGGIACSTAEFCEIVSSGLKTSPSHQVLIEESVLGWKEFEMEMVRDRADNCIVVCSIENLDPMGVHTGDSITVAPALTLTDKEYQQLRNASIAVLREIGVDTGGSNVQFAIDPNCGRMLVIEMNPRVSRSSALASKATGFPIAKIAAKLAVGYTLDELKNDITGVIPASFEPTIDYVVTKLPRFAFEKFPETEPILTTSMKSVGEVMAIGRNFAESLQKGLRSLETGLTGLNRPHGELTLEQLRKASPDRILWIAQAFREGMSPESVRQASGYDPWFLGQIQALVMAETELQRDGLPTTAWQWLRCKQLGFSDARLAELTGVGEEDIASLRRQFGVRPVYKRVDSCAGEFHSATPYLYSTYESALDGQPAECEAEPSSRDKVIILGSGPNRIGQGIEFDCCCVHAAYALRQAGLETIMVNCNPETVSTDYDTSDRLYFEPLTAEDVIELIEVEQRCGNVLGVIVQLGGQTPLKLTKTLSQHIPVLGTPYDAIDQAEDRERFQQTLHSCRLLQPRNGLAHNAHQARELIDEIGYPVVIRPSYVLGGRAMAIIHDQSGLSNILDQAFALSPLNSVLIEECLQEAIEVDVDVLAEVRDGIEEVYVAGVLEHIEQAGIHSGDSACVLPPHSLSSQVVEQICYQSRLLARHLGIVGLMNVQFAIRDDSIFVLEVNPRASRTVPFVAKATGQPIAKIAARVMAGERLQDFNLPMVQHLLCTTAVPAVADLSITASFTEVSVPLPAFTSMPYTAVKEAVFPFIRFPGVDTLLGPEMKSTGEVMGIDSDFSRAFAKSQLGAGVVLPESGRVFISVRDRDKPAAIELARSLIAKGFSITATRNTAATLINSGLPAIPVNKVREGKPDIIDAMLERKHPICLIINTVESRRSFKDGLTLRRMALANNIPYYTTLAQAQVAVRSLGATTQLRPRPLQDYLAEFEIKSLRLNPGVLPRP